MDIQPHGYFQVATYTFFLQTIHESKVIHVFHTNHDKETDKGKELSSIVNMMVSIKMRMIIIIVVKIMKKINLDDKRNYQRWTWIKVMKVTRWWKSRGKKFSHKSERKTLNSDKSFILIPYHFHWHFITQTVAMKSKVNSNYTWNSCIYIRLYNLSVHTRNFFHDNF